MTSLSVPRLPQQRSIETPTLCSYYFLQTLDEIEGRLDRDARTSHLDFGASYARLAAEFQNLQGYREQLEKELLTVGPLVAPESLFAYLFSVAYTCVQVQQRLDRALRSVARQISTFAKKIHRRIATFCGLLWSDRIWFLLHGSHPPKVGLLMIKGASGGGALAG